MATPLSRAVDKCLHEARIAVETHGPLPPEDERRLAILAEEIGEFAEEVVGDGQLLYHLVAAGERATRLLVHNGGTVRGIQSHGKIRELSQVGGIILLWLAKEIEEYQRNK